MNEQQSDQTRTEVVEKLDPAKLKAAIDGIRNMKEGSIIVKCEENKTKEILSYMVSK